MQQIIRHAGKLPFPFANAVEVNNIIYVSGRLSLTDDAKPIPGTITEQTHRVMSGIKGLLESIDSDMDHIFKVNVWLSDMNLFSAFNKEYTSWFTHGFPARSVVSASLAFNLDVEIEVQAIKKFNPLLSLI